jgi:hypothetical protein
VKERDELCSHYAKAIDEREQSLALVRDANQQLQQQIQQQPQMPQQNLGGFGGQQQLQQQQALAQSIGANQMPQQQMPQQQMPPQNLIAMLQGMGNRLGSTGQPLGEEGFGPAGSRPVSGMSQGVGIPTQQPPQMPQYLPTQMDALRQQQSQMGQQAPQMPMTAPQPPQMPMKAPQQVRPEPPRMQAMRGIQKLANRQRGYNR